MRREYQRFWMCFAVIASAIVGITIVLVAVFLTLRNRMMDSMETTTAFPFSPEPLGSTAIPDSAVWWRAHPIYQIYVRSFKDTDENGIGDINGIIEQLWYLEWLGIKSVWLNPIYDSPMKDFGYDVSNYTAVDPIFGTMADLDHLIKALHDRDMFLIMDFVPNHSSNEHPYFQQSNTSDPNNPYRDYYVWHDGIFNTSTKEYDPPNNWLQNFDGPGWEWSESRRQFFYHAFLVEQPDWNFRNPNVVEHMKSIIQFWLDKGVDGFRIDAIIYAAENQSYANEPPNPAYHGDKRYAYNSLLHPYTTNQQLTYDVVGGWTDLMQQFQRETGREIFACVEAYSDEQYTMKYYEYNVSFPFNFNLISWNNETKATEIVDDISEWMNSIPADKWPNWVVGNHDNNRIATRVGGTAGSEFTDVVHMLLLLLPGTPTLYYGDEIGMNDTFVPLNETVDPRAFSAGYEFSRDPERTPMQWNDGKWAGFSDGDGRPWLPINADYKTVNVATQMATPESHLHIFKSLLALRQLDAFLNSDGLSIFELDSDNVLAFARSPQDLPLWDPVYIVVLNVGHDNMLESVDLVAARLVPVRSKHKGVHCQFSSYTGKYKLASVVLRSGNIPDQQYRLNQTVRLDSITLANGQGLVLQVL